MQYRTRAEDFAFDFGEQFPNDPKVGQIFCRSDLNNRHFQYDGSKWTAFALDTKMSFPAGSRGSQRRKITQDQIAAAGTSPIAKDSIYSGENSTAPITSSHESDSRLASAAPRTTAVDLINDAAKISGGTSTIEQLYKMARIGPDVTRSFDESKSNSVRDYFVNGRFIPPDINQDVPQGEPREAECECEEVRKLTQPYFDGNGDFVHPPACFLRPSNVPGIGIDSSDNSTDPTQSCDCIDIPKCTCVPEFNVYSHTTLPAECPDGYFLLKWKPPLRWRETLYEYYIDGVESPNQFPDLNDNVYVEGYCLVKNGSDVYHVLTDTLTYYSPYDNFSSNLFRNKVVYLYIDDTCKKFEGIKSNSVNSIQVTQNTGLPTGRYKFKIVQPFWEYTDFSQTYHIIYPDGREAPDRWADEYRLLLPIKTNSGMRFRISSSNWWGTCEYRYADNEGSEYFAQYPPIPWFESVVGEYGHIDVKLSIEPGLVCDGFELSLTDNISSPTGVIINGQTYISGSPLYFNTEGIFNLDIEGGSYYLHGRTKIGDNASAWVSYGVAPSGWPVFEEIYNWDAPFEATSPDNWWGCDNHYVESDGLVHHRYGGGFWGRNSDVVGQWYRTGNTAPEGIDTPSSGDDRYNFWLFAVGGTGFFPAIYPSSQYYPGIRRGIGVLKTPISSIGGKHSFKVHVGLGSPDRNSMIGVLFYGREGLLNTNDATEPWVFDSESFYILAIEGTPQPNNGTDRRIALYHSTGFGPESMYAVNRSDNLYPSYIYTNKRGAWEGTVEFEARLNTFIVRIEGVEVYRHTDYTIPIESSRVYTGIVNISGTFTWNMVLQEDYQYEWWADYPNNVPNSVPWVVNKRLTPTEDYPILVNSGLAVDKIKAGQCKDAFQLSENVLWSSNNSYGGQISSDYLHAKFDSSKNPYFDRYSYDRELQEQIRLARYSEIALHTDEVQLEDVKNGQVLVYSDGVWINVDGSFLGNSTSCPTGHPFTDLTYVLPDPVVNVFPYNVEASGGYAVEVILNGLVLNYGLTGDYIVSGNAVVTTSGCALTPGDELTIQYVGCSGYGTMNAGPTGPRGFSGYSGYSGLMGYSGYVGSMGYSGFSGASGRSGMGVSGYSGMSGFSGRSGFSGASGRSGMGVSGYSGMSGFSGRSGFSGFSGKEGAAASSGYSGASGYSGLGGASGYSGSSGYSGYGLPGISGYSGDSGMSGWSGFSGKDGYSGTPGAPGTGGQKHPDNLPEYPDSWDEEFNTGTLDTQNKWTRTASNVTEVINSGIFTISVTQAGGGASYEQGISGSTKIRSKIAMTSSGTGYTNYNQAGLTFYNANSGKRMSFHIGHIDGAKFELGKFNENTWSSSVQYSLGGDDDNTLRQWVYIEIEYDGTNVYFRVSYNGVSFTTVCSEAASSWLGGAPTKAGFRVSGSESGLPRMSIDWIRRIGSNYDTTFGGSVGTSGYSGISGSTGASGFSGYSGASGQGKHLIQNSGAAVTSRANINITGSGVSVTDDQANDSTVVTISAEAPCTATYYGDPTVDGSWKVAVSGTALVHYRRESSDWVEKSRIPA